MKLRCCFAIGVLLLLTFLGASLAQADWVRRYNGSANSDDRAAAIAFDPVGGGVVVTGYATIKVLYYQYHCYQTIKYDATGNVKWGRWYTLGGNAAEAHAVAVDQAGNVYVTGRSGNGTNDDYATLKYDAAGNQKWVRRYNGPANSSDWANAIAVDMAGNVYVTGWSPGSGTGSDYATLKYDANGNQKWVKRYNGPANGGDGAAAIAVDQAGNVYVTGRSWNGSNYDYATIKYDTAGNQKWVRRYNGPANGFDNGAAIAVDQAGNVYVTGCSDGYGNLGDYATLKYDAAGNLKWVRRYNGPTNDTDAATAIAVDQAANVYVTGYSFGIGTNYDYATVKYDTNGNQKWVKRYNGPANGIDWASAIAVDQVGNVYVTGRSNGSGTGSDYATLKYDAAGNTKWVKRYNGPANFNDRAAAIALDKGGGVYVTGDSAGINTESDYCTIKYSP